jgi:hypothetical protein
MAPVGARRAGATIEASAVRRFLGRRLSSVIGLFLDPLLCAANHSGEEEFGCRPKSRDRSSFRVKRLHQVIVCACIQAFYQVLLGIL